MGAVEHLKTLCCLGLPPESAMVSVTPLMHEIIPHGAIRSMLFEPDASAYAAYTENPETTSVWLANAWAKRRAQGFCAREPIFPHVPCAILAFCGGEQRQPLSCDVQEQAKRAVQQNCRRLRGPSLPIRQALLRFAIARGQCPP